MSIWMRALHIRGVPEAAALLAGLALGGGFALFVLQAPPQGLVHARASSSGSIEQWLRRVNPPELKPAIDALSEAPPWVGVLDGREAARAPAPTAPPPAPRWVLVGSVSAPDGRSIVLHQPESGLSKRFKEREPLPDGRMLVSIEKTALILKAAKSKKTERVEFGSGLVIESMPTTTGTAPISP